MINIIKIQDHFVLTDLQLTEANMAYADAFKAELISLLNTHQKKIVLSMHQVSYIDSTFLGALVASLKHAISLNLDVILVGLKKDISDLLSLIRLDKVFKIYDNFNAATSV